MKKLITVFAVVALALTACKKDECDVCPAPETHTLDITIVPSTDDSVTASISWTVGDGIDHILFGRDDSTTAPTNFAGTLHLQPTLPIGAEVDYIIITKRNPPTPAELTVKIDGRIVRYYDTLDTTFIGVNFNYGYFHY